VTLLKAGAAITLLTDGSLEKCHKNCGFRPGKVRHFEEKQGDSGLQFCAPLFI